MFNGHRVLLERTYRDDQGNFKTNGSLDTNDVPDAILALRKAYEYLTGRKKADEMVQDESWPGPMARIP